MRTTTYEICVRGRVTEWHGPAVEGMHLETRASETLVTGEILDESQLSGFLDSVRVLGLELVSARPQPAPDNPH